MGFRIQLSHRARVAAGAAALAAGVLGATAAAVVYVGVDRLDVVNAKRSVAKTVTTVERNAALTVVAQEGHWYKVQIGDKQGYVFENAVSEKPGGAAGQGVSLASVKGGTIPQLETAAAVKGVGEGARQYASGSGLRTTGLEEMIRRRDAITPQEFEQFVAGGGLPGTAMAPTPQADAIATAKN
jgi:hypothetical protein